MGYGEDEYLIDKKVIRSRDIVFMEQKIMANWEKEKSESSSDPTRKEK